MKDKICHSSRVERFLNPLVLRWQAVVYIKRGRKPQAHCAFNLHLKHHCLDIIPPLPILSTIGFLVSSMSRNGSRCTVYLGGNNLGLRTGKERCPNQIVICKIDILPSENLFFEESKYKEHLPKPRCFARHCGAGISEGLLRCLIEAMTCDFPDQTLS